MSIQTIQKKTFHVIRLEPDLFPETDAREAKSAVELALSKGIKNLIVSVSTRIQSNRPVIFELLAWCKETVGREHGQLMFIEKYSGDETIYHSMCEALRIPFFVNRRRTAY